MSISSVSSSSSLAGATRPDPSEFLQKMFARLDGDGDGKVTQDEFTTAMEKRLGADASASSATTEAATVFQKMDSDGDGGINLSEFKTALETIRATRGGSGGPQGAGGPPPPGGGDEASASEDAQQVFDAMDTNKDGKVSADELLAALKKQAAARSESAGKSDGAIPSDADFQKAFDAIDSDADGSISQAELTSLFQQLRGPHHGERTGYGADGEPSYEGAVGDNLSTVA